MYIHRIILRDVHNFDDLDITFYDDVWQKPLNSVLITGPNGSGKTTILRVISALWDNFGEWIRLDVPAKPLHPLLANAGLVAIEIKEAYPLYGLGELTLPFVLYPDGEYFDSTWLFCTSNTGNFEKLKKIVNKQYEKDAVFVGVVGGEKVNFTDIEQEWLKTIEQHKSTLEVGVTELQPIPNMIFFDTLNRYILTPQESQLPSPTPESIYRWLITYKGTERWDGHIETVLRNMKLRNPLEFTSMLDTINQFFGGDKKIIDFDKFLRLRVEITRNHQYHSLSELSSGEQQCLIMMVMVSRWLMPGGVVLIDEPDLHLHESLQRHFIHELEKIVHERNGQLIIASHSREMRDEFSETQRRRLGVKEIING